MRFLSGWRRAFSANLQTSGGTTIGFSTMTTRPFTHHSLFNNSWLPKTLQLFPPPPIRLNSPPATFSYSPRWNYGWKSVVLTGLRRSTQNRKRLSTRSRLRTFRDARNHGKHAGIAVYMPKGITSKETVDTRIYGKKLFMVIFPEFLGSTSYSPKFQHHTKLYSKWCISFVSSLNLSQYSREKEAASRWMPLLTWTVLELITRAYLASLVTRLLRWLKYSIFSSCFWCITICARNGCLEIKITLVFFSSTFISIPHFPTSTRLSLMPCSTVCIFHSANYLSIFKSPNPARASFVRYSLYKLNKISEKQHPCSAPLPIWIILVSPCSNQSYCNPLIHS